MKRAFASLGVVLVLILGLSWLLSARTPSQQLEAKTGFVVGEPVHYENLTIFPVLSQTPRKADRFITLDEGLRAGTVEVLELSARERDDRDAQPPANPPGATIQPPAEDPFADAPQAGEPPSPVSDDPFGDSTEQQSQTEQQAGQVAGDPFDELVEGVQAAIGGNDVNRLLVINRSDKPLYLMPGEILLGGDQDRAVGQELVVQPSKEPVEVAVFCVEHGRWGDRDPEELRGFLATANQNQLGGFSANLSLVTSQTEAVEEANSGKFIGSVGSLNKAGRMAVQAEGQQTRVWEEVAKENEKGGVQSQTGAFTNNYASADSARRLQPYLDQLERPVSMSQNVVGVIVAVNGKPQSMDVFESTPLFKKLWPKLLRSYALDAANAEQDSTKSCDREKALAFFDKARNGQPQKQESSGGLAVTSVDTDDVLIFSAHEAFVHDARPAATTILSDGVALPAGATGLSGRGAGLGGAIHSAGYAK